jgi:hypothetical protein
MRQYLSAVVVGAATAVMLLTAIAAAQAPVTLQDQLAAQYKVAKMAGSGTVVVETGTVLEVQKGGILSLPWRALALCPAKFQDNALHPPTGFCAGVMLHNYFQKGTKVYPLKIEVSVDKAKITFRVVSCDECNGVDPPAGFKGEVVFQFAKGYLEKAGAGEVENTIGQVFAISDDQQQDQAGGQQDQRRQQESQTVDGRQQGTARQQSPQQQPAEPQTVQLGMTTDQVQSTLGKPDKVFNLGAKQIYVYKDVKVTFIDGKVNDVQ